MQAAKKGPNPKDPDLPKGVPPRNPFERGPGGKFGQGKDPLPPIGPVQPPRGNFDEVEVNLELVLYAEVTLYNRFPPRPPEATASPSKN